VWGEPWIWDNPGLKSGRVLAASWPQAIAGKGALLVFSNLVQGLQGLERH